MEESLRIGGMERQGSARLGDIASLLLDERISPQQAKYGQLADAWSQLLPAELHKHCRLADFSSGRLKVAADSSAYVYELQLCSHELLRALQQMCPATRITKIKVTIG